MAEIIWTTNIRGIISKFNILHYELQHHKPSLVIICETFLTPMSLTQHSKSQATPSLGRTADPSVAASFSITKNSLQIHRTASYERADVETIWFKMTSKDKMEIIGCGAYCMAS
jgi:hypothetical protein